MELWMDRKEGNVLVVDDEQHILEVLEDMLISQNYCVFKAGSAEDALAVISAQQIDLVISDEVMPGMSGTDFLNIIRYSHPDTIAMILTGHADLQTAIKAINDGQVYKFLTKPIVMVDLLVSVQQALQHQHCIKEVNRLNKKVEDQQSYISELENSHPGISDINRDSSGAIIIEDN